MKRLLDKDPETLDKHAYTTEDDIVNDYTVIVKTHDPRKRSNVEFLPHHTVISPSKQGETRQILYEADNFHGESLIKFLFVGSDMWIVF